MTDISVSTSTSTASTGSGTTSTPAQVAAGTSLGIVGALVLNAAVFLIATRNEPLRVVAGGESGVVDLGFAPIATASAVWILIGGVGLWVLERLGSVGTRIWTTLVVVITALSMVPVTQLDVDTRSKAGLAVVHLVVGAAAVAGQQLARRR